MISYLLDCSNEDLAKLERRQRGRSTRETRASSRFLHTPSTASSCLAGTATEPRRRNNTMAATMMRLQALATRRQPMPSARRATRASPSTAPAPPARDRPGARDRKGASALPALGLIPAMARVHPYLLPRTPLIQMSLPRRWQRRRRHLRHRLLCLRAPQPLAEQAQA